MSTKTQRLRNWLPCSQQLQISLFTFLQTLCLFIQYKEKFAISVKNKPFTLCLLQISFKQNVDLFYRIYWAADEREKKRVLLQKHDRARVPLWPLMKHCPGRTTLSWSMNLWFWCNRKPITCSKSPGKALVIMSLTPAKNWVILLN